jgi:alkanesulfonate monooxygenase SsuD/methylene tetrahydromethanopterin reductase-like flavin-dependent oxidoreductase (luciferase family)
MKLLMFHLMPYRERAPETLRDAHHGLQVTIPKYLFNPDLASRFYNESLDELEHAARLGFDGVCVNEHHQMAYGMMPSPNIILSSLIRRTSNLALVTLGTSAALYNPPIRVAEEFAMLDCISGGRVIAGFPVGTPMDSNYAYGMNPALLRERYYEAVELITRAWVAEEPFSFDGRFTQLRYVSPWPRPYQSPHPPIWVPGGASIETWSWTIEHDYLYAALSYGGYQAAASTVAGFWDTVDRMGKPRNPYRLAFLQLVCVGQNEDELEEAYGPHVEYFYNRLLHPTLPGFVDPPGYRSLDSIRAAASRGRPLSTADTGRARTWQDFVRTGAVVAGTPKQVTEELEHVATSLNIGHLLLLCQIGSMPHELAMENIRLTATEVIPNLRHVFDDTGFTDEWWLRGGRP